MGVSGREADLSVFLFRPEAGLSGVLFRPEASLFGRFFEAATGPLREWPGSPRDPPAATRV